MYIRYISSAYEYNAMICYLLREFSICEYNNFDKYDKKKIKCLSRVTIVFRVMQIKILILMK